MTLQFLPRRRSWHSISAVRHTIRWDSSLPRRISRSRTAAACHLHQKCHCDNHHALIGFRIGTVCIFAPALAINVRIPIAMSLNTFVHTATEKLRSNCRNRRRNTTHPYSELLIGCARLYLLTTKFQQLLTATIILNERRKHGRDGKTILHHGIKNTKACARYWKINLILPTIIMQCVHLCTPIESLQFVHSSVRLLYQDVSSNWKAPYYLKAGVPGDGVGVTFANV